MKKTKGTTTTPRKLVVRTEAIATLAVRELTAVVGGVDNMPMSRPPGCGSTSWH